MEGEYWIALKRYCVSHGICWCCRFHFWYVTNKILFTLQLFFVTSVACYFICNFARIIFCRFRQVKWIVWFFYFKRVQITCSFEGKWNVFSAKQLSVPVLARVTSLFCRDKSTKPKIAVYNVTSDYVTRLSTLLVLCYSSLL